MDCLEAQALISAAFDTEKVDPRALAEAQAHCDECDDCRAFSEGLAFIGASPVPAAPPAAVDAALAAVAAAAVERANAERFEAMQREVELLAAADALPEIPVAAGVEPAAAPESPARPAAETVRPEWMPPVPESTTWTDRAKNWISSLDDSVKWAGIGAAGALAATALIAFLIVGTGGGGRPTSVASTSDRGASAPTGGGLTYGSGTATEANAPSAPVVTTAPDYVGFNGRVFTPGALLADSSAATPTIGTVRTAFATGGGIQDAPAFASPLKDGSIVISGPDGFRLYSPVVRRLSSKRFQLVAGNEIERFGVWPTLPSRFTTPISSDGSPSFTAAGSDSLGVPVFAASGQAVSLGFAVAPGTQASDPAAGNPTWTWWEPID